jgi:hypothetical protein
VAQWKECILTPGDLHNYPEKKKKPGKSTWRQVEMIVEKSAEVVVAGKKNAKDRIF